MATKQITDLTLATSFDPGDLLLLRKTGEGVDKAITQQKFIETLGNPSVTGFVGTSAVANQVVLTPSNDVVIDKYYNEMIVTFISPITSTGAVSVQIAGLTLKLLQELGTTTTSTLATGKYYSAIYNSTDGKFYQTNLIVPYIFTNEYTAVGTVQAGETSTKYALTTAIGTSKTVTGYYTGMAALFTANIASKGAVILNIDGLGEKSLQDPVGDNIPFDLLANESIMAIYDGTVFRKRMFSQLEPNPIDPPIDPPAEIFYVGPSRALKFVTQAIFQLVNTYAEDGGGRTAIIQLDSAYQWGTSEAALSYNTPWITVKTATLGNNINSFIRIINKATLNFTGIFNFASFVESHHLLMDSEARGAYLSFKDSTINNVGSISATQYLCYNSGTGCRLDFENVNINNYDALANGTDEAFIFNYYTGAVAIKYSTTNVQPIINTHGTTTLQNVAFGSVTKGNATTTLFKALSAFIFNNVTITTPSDINIFTAYFTSNLQSILTNCVMKNTSTSLKPAVLAQAGLIIDGGDYRRTLVTTAKDIFATDYAAAIIRLRNTPLGETGQQGRGQIISE